MVPDRRDEIGLTTPLVHAPTKCAEHNHAPGEARSGRGRNQTWRGGMVRGVESGDAREPPLEARPSSSPTPPAHTPSPGAGASEVDWRPNGAADAQAKCAAALVRVQADRRAERMEDLRHLRTVHDVFAATKVAALAAAHAHGLR